jgi:tetratricopeptide (TPR) repeat protein
MTPRLSVVLMIVALEGAAFAAPSAEQLFEQGQTSFDKGDYASAVAQWNESYRLSKEPELLFNVAQALENDGRCAEALATYRRFIALAPRSAQRPLADDFIAELEPKCGKESSPHVDHVSDQVENTRSGQGHNLKLAGLATGGSGVVLVATGLLFGRRASTLGEEVTRACSVSCDWAEQRSKDAAGRRSATIGYALDVLGVAAIVGGAVMYYLGDRASTVTVSPTSRDGGAILSWGGSW